MNQLEDIFSELGISHYLGAFVDQGFDSWETILDITESDLDALGVKLGHRRKLQRRIANYRGLQVPITTLVSPTRTSIEDAPVNGNKAAQPEPKDGTSSTKRKYRRHPKADENAPERPPSAYVLFSNKMREDLKGQNLTFTEIAKLVGENWQNLDRHEKEPYETQAQEAKERYSREMNEYKKTPEYQKYCDYLQEFRKRQATQDKDAAKRIKTDAENNYRGSSASTSMASNGVASGGSTSDSQHGSEPPPSRRQRMNSGASGSEARDSPNTNTRALQTPPDHLTQSPRRASGEDAPSTRPRGLSSPGTQDGLAAQPHRRPSNMYDNRLSSEGSSPCFFPSLSAAVQAPPPSHSPESLASSVPSLPVANSSGHASGASNFWSRPPSLRTEQSSSGSISSLASHSAPRTPSEASLPIHALLSSKPDPFPAMQPQHLPSPAAHDVPGPLRPSYPMHQHPGHHGGDTRPYMNNSMSPTQTSAAAGPERRASTYATGSVAHLPPPMPSVQTLPNPLKDKARPSAVSRPVGASPDAGLDGMSALLRASDIVGRGNV